MKQKKQTSFPVPPRATRDVILTRDVSKQLQQQTRGQHGGHEPQVHVTHGGVGGGPRLFSSLIQVWNLIMRVLFLYDTYISTLTTKCVILKK